MRLDLRIALAYAIFGGFWILITDSLLNALVPDHDLLARLQTYKGWVFVALGSVLLFLLVRRELRLRRMEKEARHEQEERSRAYIERASDYIFTLDPQGNFTFVNVAMCAALGYREKDLLGKPALTVVAPEAHQEAAQVLQRIWDGETVDYMDLPVQTRDGKTLLVQIRGRAFYHDGKLVETLHIARDTTLQKQAEEAIKNSERRLNALIADGLDFISLLDAQGDLLWESPSANSLLGYRFNEFLGRSILELVHPEDLEWVQRQFAEVAATPGSRQSGVFRMKRADGEYRWVETVASNFLDDPAVGAIVINYRDITERKQTEGALRESEARFREALEFLPIPIGLADRQGRIIHFNQKFTETYGYTTQDVPTIGDWMAQAYPESEYRDAILFHWARRIEKSFRDNAATELREFKVTCKDGSQRDVEIIARGMGNLIIASFNDITERKRAEESLNDRLAELELLYQSGLTLSGELDPKQVAGKLIEALEKKMDWHHIAIRNYDSESDQLELLAFKQPSLESEAQRQAVEERFNVVIPNSSQGMSGWAVLHGETVRSGNVHEDERYIETYPDIRSGLYTPILLGGRVIGVISVESKAGNAFSESDERLLKTVANQAAIAFENARLFQNLQIELAERKRAEKAAHESQARYLALFEQMHDAVFILDLEGRHLAVNQRAADMLEYTPEEIIGLSVRELSAESEKSSQVIERILAGETIPLYERLFRKKGGEVFSVEINAELVRDGQGKPLHIQSVVRDITERKQAEEERTLFFNTLAASLNEIYIFDAQSLKFQMVNSGALRNLQISIEEARQMTPLDIKPEFTEAAFQRIVAPLRTGEKQMQVFETVHRRADGTLYPVEVHLQLFEKENIFLAIIQDITERKQAEKELRESEKRFSATFDQAAVGIAHVATDGRWLRVNHKLCDIVGYSQDELLTKTFQDITHPDDLETDLLYVRQVLADEIKTYSMEKRYIRKNGSIVWINLTVSLVRDADGKPGYFISVVEDIVQRKMAEKQLTALQEFTHATLDALSANICVIDETGKIEMVNQSWKDFALSNNADPSTLSEGVNYFAACENATGVERQQAGEFAAGIRLVLDGKCAEFSMEYPCHAEHERRWFIARVTRFQANASRRAVIAHMNITGRKLAEEALHVSEERFSTVFHSSPNPIAVTRLADGKLIDMNEAWQNLTGYAWEEAIGRSPIELNLWVEPSERARLTQIVADHESVRAFEMQLRMRSGEIRTLLMSAEIVLLQGELCSLSTAQDITELKQAEDKLREREARYRTLFENSPIALWEEDFSEIKQYLENLKQQGIENLVDHFAEHPDELLKCSNLIRITDANRSALEIYQAKTKNDLIENVNQTISAGELAHLLPALTDIADGRLHGGWEGTDETLTGRLIDIILTWSVVPGYEEDYSKVIVTTVDITDQKKAEEKLRESEARFSSIFHSSPIGILLTQMTDGLILELNDAFLQLFGYSREEAIGRTTLDLGLFADPAERGRLIALLREQGGFKNIESDFRKRSGEIGNLLVSAEVINLSMGPCVLSMLADITERKKAETEIHQRVRELETVNHISMALRASLNLEQALAVMLEETLNVFDTRHGAISLWDAESDALREAIARGWLVAVTERPIRAGEGIFGIVFASGETHVSAEFASDPLTLPESRSILPLGWGGACIPIRAKENILGVLTVAIPNPRVFRREDIRLLETLAEMAGTALHRMSLNEDVQRHLERLQSLRQIDMAITGGFDRRATLETILKQVISQLGVSAADILMLDPQMNRLNLGAYQGFTQPLNETIDVPIGKGFAGIAVSENRMVSADLQRAREVPEFYKLWQREGFSSYHAVPLVVKDRPVGVLETYQRTASTPDKEWFNFLEMLAGQAAIALENTGLFEDLESANTELMHAYDTTIEGWSHAMDLRDKETEGHTLRVTHLTLKLARIMGASPAELVHIRRGALLHDIGKIGIPDRILLKPDKLTDEEWEVMRKHPTFALEMLEPIHYLKPALNIPYCHHEKWDGSGYPRGLAGEQIPIAGRIFAVVDVWDALTSDRPYRPAWTKEKALDYIREQSGKHFDPDVVYVFLRLTDEEREIRLQSTP
jgi:PAS domain S-box-containing protein/putative nucleotidyltransferase with HDIG domain